MTSAPLADIHEKAKRVACRRGRVPNMERVFSWRRCIHHLKKQEKLTIKERALFLAGVVAKIVRHQCSHDMLNQCSKLCSNLTVDRSASKRIDYGLNNRGIPVRSPAGVIDFLFSTTSTSTLWPRHPPIQWVPEVLSAGVKGLEAWRWPLNFT
jgi:hypothetical protein